MILVKDFLEDFSTLLSGPVTSGIDLEKVRSESFEEGYRAGWDDAVKAQSSDGSRISQAFAQHLQDLSFTYHEAYGQVMNAVVPLLEEMVNSVLPDLARVTLGQHIVDHLKSKVREIGALDVEIVVSPVNAPAVAALLGEGFGFPVRLVEDANLSDAQADIRFGETENQIDLNAVLASINEALQGFAHDNRRKLANA